MSTLTRYTLLVSVLLLSTSVSFAQDFYLDSNGVTIRCENATPGDTGTVFGVEFLAVDNNTVRSEIGAGRDMATVCTSHVTLLHEVLIWNSGFNDNIASWDVSRVESFRRFLEGATAFNRDISFWDVSSAREMSAMFNGAKAFNQDLGNWDVSNVRNFAGMFANASSFDQDLSQWDVSSATNMTGMFGGAVLFKSDISSWDVIRVKSFASMFDGAVAFNQPIGDWNLSSATNLSTMFRNALSFDQNIGAWDVTDAIDMGGMFHGAISFNQDISGWDVMNVENMENMFDNATSFDKNLSRWCLPKIGVEPNLFAFNAPIEGNSSFLPQWGCEVPPNAVPFASAESGQAPFEVILSAFSSFDLNSDPLTYLWDLGDGTTSTDMVVSHTYPAGVYTITLTVSDGTFEHTAAIRIESINEAPAVNLQASSLMGQAPVEITFDGSGSSDANGDSLSFAWDLGDGATSTERELTHTYTAAGDYNVVLRVSDGLESASDSVMVSIASGVAIESTALPERYELHPSYPNPFNPTTTVTYGLPAAAEVRITATDLLGRQVATLVTGETKAAGYHTVPFNADGLASGTYLIRMEAGDFVATQRVVLLK